MQYGPLYNLNSYLTIKTSRISFKIFMGSRTPLIKGEHCRINKPCSCINNMAKGSKKQQ
jgi:hypothetical protein